MRERTSVGASGDDVRGARARRGRLLLAGGALALALLVVVRFADPETSGWYPGCPWHRLTGWKCAGCGATRAAHALTRGRVAEALAWNPGFVIAWPILAAIAVFRGRWFGSPRFWVLFAAVIAAYVVFRNR